MRKFFLNLKHNILLKRIIYISNIVFLTMYSFSIPAFSGRYGYNVISYVAMALLGIVSISYFILFKQLTWKNRLFFFLLLFLFLSLLSTVLFSKQYRSWVTLLLLSASCVIFYLSFHNIGDIKITFYVLAFSYFLFSLYFLIHYLPEILNSTGITSPNTRMGSYFDNVNHVGSHMSIGYVVTLYLSLFAKKKRELLSILLLPFFIVVGLLTGSRTFFISVAISSIVLVFARFKSNKMILIGVLIGLITIATIIINLPFLSFLKEQIIKAFNTIFGIGETAFDGSTMQRMLWQRYGFYLGTRNFLIGYGCNGFSIFSGVGTYTHGNLSEVFCNFGLLGSLAFYSLLLVPFVLGFNCKHSSKYLIFCFFVYYFVNNFLSVYYVEKDLYIIIAMMFYIIRNVEIEYMFPFYSRNKCKCFEVNI